MPTFANAPTLYAWAAVALFHTTDAAGHCPTDPERCGKSNLKKCQLLPTIWRCKKVSKRALCQRSKIHQSIRTSARRLRETLSTIVNCFASAAIRHNRLERLLRKGFTGSYALARAGTGKTLRTRVSDPAPSTADQWLVPCSRPSPSAALPVALMRSRKPVPPRLQIFCCTAPYSATAPPSRLVSRNAGTSPGRSPPLPSSSTQSTAGPAPPARRSRGSCWPKHVACTRSKSASAQPSFALLIASVSCPARLSPPDKPGIQAIPEPPSSHALSFFQPNQEPSLRKLPFRLGCRIPAQNRKSINQSERLRDALGKKLPTIENCLRPPQSVVIA